MEADGLETCARGSGLDPEAGSRAEAEVAGWTLGKCQPMGAGDTGERLGRKTQSHDRKGPPCDGSPAAP